MLFEGGATASFTMNAFTPDIRRETRICGSLGELRLDLCSNIRKIIILISSNVSIIGLLKLGGMDQLPTI